PGTLRQNPSDRAARTGNTSQTRKILCGLLAFVFPFAAAFAQSSSSSQQSSSSPQQSSAQAQTPSQAQPATPDQPQKQDSLAEAARKAKANKPAPAKGKVYTEDDLSKMKSPGVSVVGDGPIKSPRRTQPRDPDGDGGENNEQYWREQARQILDAIAQTDEQIAQKKEEIKKFGSGGFDVASGRQDNIAYINDRNGQLKELENRKLNLQKQLDDLADEGRKAGAPASWFR
ncbi:MAG: hypothetical protein ACHP79_12625, partial [Terriglobales bacterium]